MAAISSAVSGLWSVPTTWTGGVVPTSADAVTIGVGHIVELDGLYTVLSIVISGTVKWSRIVNSSLTQLTSLGYFVNATGVIDMGTVASPINTVKADLAMTSAGSVGTVYNTHDGAKFYSYGDFRTRGTQLTAPALSAQAVVVVKDATGWKAGDRISLEQPFVSIGGVALNAFHSTISTIVGNTVTLAAVLPYALTIDAVIGNEESNVTVRSADLTEVPRVAQPCLQIDVQTTLADKDGLPLCLMGHTDGT